MADIKVDLEGLERFKNTVNTNWQQFDQIRQNLSSHLANLRANDFETEGAKDFDVVFKDSEKDIQNLVNTMQEFVTYLNKKIEQGRVIHTRKVSL